MKQKLLALVSTIVLLNSLLTACRPSTEKEDVKGDTSMIPMNSVIKMNAVIKENSSVVSADSVNDELKPDIATILATTQPQELYIHYGEKNISKEKLLSPEANEGIDQYVLFKGTENALYIRYDDAQPWISVKTKSDIELPHGLKVGMTVDDLIAINGQQLTFYGFGWDHGGLVSSFNGGKLENQGIALILRADERKPAYRKFSGDSEFNTADRDASTLNLRIGEITLWNKKL